MRVERAAPADLEGVRRLLREAGLPVTGLEDQFPAAYRVVRATPSPAGDSTVVAAGGLERHGTAGLLRSVVVAASHGGRGLGARVVRALLDGAAEQGLPAVYLLTTTAPRYFERFGFVPAPREAAPDAIRNSPEFASVCPASATCLVRAHSNARVVAAREDTP